MKILSILIVLAVNLLYPAQTKNSEVYSKLVFFDDFKGNKLDSKKWSVETGPRNLAINTEKSVIINNGLKIHTYRDTKNDTIYTAIISTAGHFEFNKGIIEIKAKFDDVPGSWSDCWVWAKSVGKEEVNPYENGAELDFFEHRIYDSSYNYLGNKVNYASHYNGYSILHEGNYIVTDNFNLSDHEFHIFKTIWADKYCAFFIDNYLTAIMDIPNTNKKMFLLLSTEISAQVGWVPSPTQKIDNFTLEVEYIKVWQN